MLHIFEAFTILPQLLYEFSTNPKLVCVVFGLAICVAIPMVIFSPQKQPKQPKFSQPKQKTEEVEKDRRIISIIKFLWEKPK